MVAWRGLEAEGICVDISLSTVVRKVLVVVLYRAGVVASNVGSISLHIHKSARVKQMYATTYHGVMRSGIR